MILTNKQEQALKICIERYNNNEKYTCISGYAGTGKSTIVKFLVEALGIDKSYVCYATYTGKAAQVLLNKGNKNVSTMHKLLYTSYPKADGTFVRVPKTSLVPYKLIIADEVSMIPKTLMDLLFQYHVHVICLGDPFQLPPVDKNEDNHLLDHPHIFLDEIMRQVKESEIIQLTMKIRSGQSIPYNCGKEVQVLSKKDLIPDMKIWADQILVAMNKTRDRINQEMRELLNKTEPLPMEGDKVICTRNYWDIVSSNENSLINGTIGYLNHNFQSKYPLPKWAGGGNIDVTISGFETDADDKFSSLEMDTKMILTGEKCVDKKTEYRLHTNPKTRAIVPLEFAYGYAITCHKSQGSEWDKVLVIEENFPFNREEHARWLYTACTRASKKLVLIR